MAAEAIRALTGPIQIRQEKIPGRPGARWIATFAPDLNALLRKLAKDHKYPEAQTLATVPGDTQPVEVVIDKVPKYERLAPLFKQLRDNGASIQTIASAHQMAWEYVRQILQFVDTGQRPTWGSGKGIGTSRDNTEKYKKIAPQVVEMRAKKISFAKIAKELGIGDGTVRRAYDYGRPDAVREAAEQGETPCRGRYSHLSAEIFQNIRNLLGEGRKVKDIAQQLGCGVSTVYRVRRDMLAESGDDQAA
jgi:hypothetical protein